MSISGIFDPSIDIKSWINQSIQSGKAPTDSMSDHLKHLITDLRYQYDNKDYEFEKASEDAVSSIPTILCEIEQVSIESRKVHQQIEKFYMSLAKIEKQASNSINLLSEIDSVKNRMETCLVSLDSVDKLIQSKQKLTNLHESENVNEIAKQIEETKQNLTIVGDLKQFNGTRQQLVQLENKLEEMAKPLLITSLNEKNTNNTKQMIELFQQMERKQELYDCIKDYYLQKVTELWNKLTDNMQDSESTFASCLSNFYTKFAILLEKDIRWIHRLLSNEYSFSSTFLFCAMENLCNSYKSFLDQHTEDMESSSNKILEIWHLAAQFYSQIVDIIGYSDTHEQIQILESIFSPFIPIQREYANITKRKLLYELKSNILINPSEFTKTIEQLESRIPRIFHLCEDSTRVFIEFTGGVNMELFINALSDVFVEYLNNWLTVLQELRVQSKIDIIESKNTNLDSLNSYDPSFSHDWTYVQGALQVLHASNEFSSKFNSLDGYLRNKFNTQGNILQSNQDLSNVELFFFSHEAHKNITQITKFIDHLSDVSYKLLPTPHRMYVTFNTRIQSFVFDTMFQFIKEKLSDVPVLKNWEQQAQVSPAGIEIPTFSLSPLGYITQIGEHLFALPQQLAPFASGELSDNEEDVDTGFVSQWLQHLSSNTMSLYIQKICQIRKITTMGIKQLITDIEYLCEVLSPFGIDPDPSLQITLEFLRSTKEDYVAFLQSLNDNSSIKIGNTIADMRNIKLPNNLKQSQ